MRDIRQQKLLESTITIILAFDHSLVLSSLLRLLVSRSLHGSRRNLSRSTYTGIIEVTSMIHRFWLFSSDQSLVWLIALEWAIWRLTLDKGVFLVHVAFIFVPILLSQVY